MPRTRGSRKPFTSEKVIAGVTACSEAVLDMLAEASLSAVIAVMAMGTFCKFSDRF